MVYTIDILIFDFLKIFSDLHMNIEYSHKDSNF